MTRILSQSLQYTLALADGSSWLIAAGDEETAFAVSRLGDTMQMNPTTGAAEPPHQGIVRRLLVLADARNNGASPTTCFAPLPSESDGTVVCVVRPFYYTNQPPLQLIRLSLIIARDTQARGGVLLHGALAERDGNGVILAAPHGTGKTTASNRLMTPWNSLCDDITLVVRDSQGNYMAHPWPTWSRFLRGDSAGNWKVQHAVPLKGIFFLAQAPEDRVERVGSGQAVSLLVHCATQASQYMTRGLDKDETRALHLERFNNLCALARAIPGHVLHVSLTGAFWQEIEQALS